MGAAALKAGHSKGIEFLTDALGTVRDVVDDTGAVIQSYEFNEHGLPMPGSGSSSGTFSPKTYQGALSVNDDRNDSGLYLMGHRHYAADLGRFISRDPIGFDGGLNLFNGAGTSPVTRMDPTGLDDVIIVIGTRADGSSYNAGPNTYRNIAKNIANDPCYKGDDVYIYNEEANNIRLIDVSRAFSKHKGHVVKDIHFIGHSSPGSFHLSWESGRGTNMTYSDILNVLPSLDVRGRIEMHSCQSAVTPKKGLSLMEAMYRRYKVPARGSTSPMHYENAADPNKARMVPDRGGEWVEISDE